MWHCSIPWLTGTQFPLWIPALRLAICDLLHYHLAPLLQSDDLFAACLLFGHFLCLLLRLHHPVCLCGYMAKSRLVTDDSFALNSRCHHVSCGKAFLAVCQHWNKLKWIGCPMAASKKGLPMPTLCWEVTASKEMLQWFVIHCSPVYSIVIL